jgi:outer membrane protein W
MKKQISIVLLLLAAAAVHAQDLSGFRINYDMAIPTGGFNADFINKTSWRGISFDSRWEVKENVTAGFNIGWQVFSQRLDNITEVLGNGGTTVNGTQFRYVNTFPMQANVHYYFGDEYMMRPWVGLSIGTAFSDQRTQVGFSEIKRTSWSFAVTPQVGLDIPLNSDEVSFTVNMRYNQFFQNEVSFDYSFLVFSAGFKFLYH